MKYLPMVALIQANMFTQLLIVFQDEMSGWYLQEEGNS